MTHPTFLGYAAKAAGQALERSACQTPSLREGDVRVAVTHCGVCYTDVHGIDDFYGITSYPFVPGHEIVGYVSALGSVVSGLKVGDRVGIGWQGRSCGQCEWCARGHEQLCQEIVDSAAWVPNGGFSASVIADSRFAHPLPAEMPSEVAAVLLCAGISVYSPLKSYAGPACKKIGIIGVGGLGHLAIQFAAALGYRVTAISSSPGKQEEALAFGASHFILAGDRAAMRKAAYAFDMLLCTAHGMIDIKRLLATLKKRGELVLVGFPTIALNPTDLVAHELSISGSFLGNPASMREMLSFAQANDIRPRIELMPMSQVNEAIRRVKENKARYRVVLVNDSVDRRGDGATGVEGEIAAPSRSG